MDLGLKGKKALLLASSQGLGLGVATALCAEGADVLISGRVDEKLRDAADALTSAGPGKASYVVADLADPSSAAALYAAATGAPGGVDILINNTGGPPPGTVEAQAIDTWQSQFDTMVVRLI